MYSNADDNSDDEDVVNSPSTLSKATLKTIELILRKVEVNLGYAAFMQCAGSQSSKAQGNASNTSRAGRGAPQGSGGKRKARAEENFPPDDPDDDGSSKRRRVSITTTTEDSENGPRFACPFYKHDPNRYRNRRTCPGPGWPTVHRMKEHLYRSHAQPIFCCRCYAMFDSDSELSNHQRGNPCPVSAPQPIDGIGRETLKSLRKRSPALRLEEDKWRDTYQLLFPDVADTDIPSPYYDSTSPTEGSRRFRRELLERIRQELFATAEREPGPVEQRLLRQVAGIIQRCESELLGSSNPASFNPSTGFLHPTMPTHRRASAPSILVEETTPSQPMLQTPTYPPGPTYSTSFHPSQPAPMSPRTTQAFNTVPEPAADNAFSQNDTPAIAFPDSFAFSTSDWIDWNVVFPPGPEVESGERTDAHPALTTPVWT
ncbi:hypothetical protein K458DRAFT_424869 [Lentithecium fluviatile CBS 122367]|uniref:C2H2-type domain-containing protein n=1 Tax=Lentithecium fluviatile CBS 122367 TaxID=1168545 RepID=A0A6G1IDS3_9PLEO|nr:hypothetical protein K458DRAFT_424869 [Lentithecium fluviatile CBS 122367]